MKNNYAYHLASQNQLIFPHFFCTQTSRRKKGGISRRNHPNIQCVFSKISYVIRVCLQLTFILSPYSMDNLIKQMWSSNSVSHFCFGSVFFLKNLHHWQLLSDSVVFNLTELRKIILWAHQERYVQIYSSFWISSFLLSWTNWRKWSEHWTRWRDQKKN